jgi:hypothetical protein
LSLPFAVQQTNQVFAYTNGCAKLVQGTSSTTTGDATINITKAVAGQPVVIGVKYNVKSILGATVAAGFTSCQDTWVTKLVNGTTSTIIPNTTASITVSAKCSSTQLTASGAAVGSIEAAERPTTLDVKAYPNPYSTNVMFKFTSPESGTAVLELYDLQGKKLAIVFQGKVDAGVEHTILYSVPAGIRTTMIYKLSVGDKTSHSMLIPEK